MPIDYEALQESIEAQIGTAATAMSRTISADSRTVSQANPVDLIRAANMIEKKVNAASGTSRSRRIVFGGPD